jgi:hypothetical protein
MFHLNSTHKTFISALFVILSARGSTIHIATVKDSNSTRQTILRQIGRGLDKLSSARWSHLQGISRNIFACIQLQQHSKAETRLTEQLQAVNKGNVIMRHKATQEVNKADFLCFSFKNKSTSKICLPTNNSCVKI